MEETFQGNMGGGGGSAVKYKERKLCQAQQDYRKH